MTTPSSPSARLSRRTFLQRTTLAGAALGFPAVLRAANPNGKVQVAALGLTGQGFSDLHNVGSHAAVRFVGFCDVDSANFKRADTEFPGVPHFADFRAMLEQLGDTVDAITVGIPDHMHALASIEAMRRGKHVYCEKPLAHTVWEIRQMARWAERKNVVTQMGTQIHSNIEYRLAVRLIQDGAIGKVREVRSWVSVAGNERTRLLEPPAPGPVPASLDWNLWLGGAPQRDFAPGVYHPFAWRDWQDFGGGAIGDFGCHILDPVFSALKLKAPLTVVASNTGINRHIWPTAQTVRYVFPGNELTAGPKLTVVWSDGGLRPDRQLAQLPPELDLPKSGSLFLGENGNLVLGHVAAPRLYPVEKFKDFAYPKDLKGLSHYHRWVDAILGGTKTTCGFDYAGPLAETVQLGNVATRVANRAPVQRGSRALDPEKEKPLAWDSTNLRFPESPAATALLTKSYRSGWAVPAAPL
ncbi:MAG: Gfo/Idh/MocA family oxidoreductase [Verrucomicrobia bacterium]|nr:Gfo/Idh/MocA family oxidoreductase [Verrucomicrobiota bacterium]